jgi:hypothetical protein
VTAGLPDGAMIEVATIGAEGMLGVEAFFGEDASAPGHTIVEVPGGVVSRQVVEIGRAFPEFTTAWTLTRPWTERAPSTASWKTTERFSTSAHTDSRYAIDARISCAVGGNAGAESCFIDSTLK